MAANESQDPITWILGAVAALLTALAFVLRGLRKAPDAESSERRGRTVEIIEQVVRQQSETTTALANITLVLTRLVERMENLPTKLDLVNAAASNRHEMRNLIMTAQSEIMEALKEDR